ncbi:MAG: tetratricopeptide repeat protein [Xenococcaceae cyanobacterium]
MTKLHYYETWFDKGMLLQEEDKLSEALACFDKVLEIEPNHAICQTARALTLVTIKSLKEIEEVEAAVAAASPSWETSAVKLFYDFPRTHSNAS